MATNSLLVDEIRYGGSKVKTTHKVELVVEDEL
jgi:hypothetical protein